MVNYVDLRLRYLCDYCIPAPVDEYTCSWRAKFDYTLNSLARVIKECYPAVTSMHYSVWLDRETDQLYGEFVSVWIDGKLCEIIEVTADSISALTFDVLFRMRAYE